MKFGDHFTSTAYFGPLSISLASNIYVLLNYGQRLEEMRGTAEYAWFLLVQECELF
jgi:hypothetical protein